MMIDSDLYVDLLTRVISLEKEINKLKEERGGVSSSDPLPHSSEYAEMNFVRDEISEKNEIKVSTRKKSIQDLSLAISNRSLDVNLEGSGNRGGNRLRVERDGRTANIYLSTSRNYGDVSVSHEPFASWHTVQKEDAENEDYGFFIFSPEDEEGNPLYFVLTYEDMQEKIRSKKSVPSKKGGGTLEYYHFTLSRSGGRDSQGFIDFRKGEESDFTEFYNAFEKLENV